MKGSTPSARGKHLKTVLENLYDKEGGNCNVIDILTDLRHLCDTQEWNYAELDRIAYNHYSQEHVSQSLELHVPP